MHTTIRNPETGGVWDCPNAVLARRLDAGWVLAADDAAPESPADEAQESPKKSKAARRGQTTSTEEK